MTSRTMISTSWSSIAGERRSDDTTDRHAGWDGKLNGKVVKNGVYTWMLRAQSVFNGVNHDLHGHVTVVR